MIPLATGWRSGHNYSRKQALLDFARSKGASVGNLQTQIDFLWKELSEGYEVLTETLKNAKTVKEASNAVLTQYERPADQGAMMQAKRSSYGVTYLNKYGSTNATTAATAALYRVRKTWADAKSQLGAYKTLTNAKKRVDKNPGYFVFDESGTAVYPISVVAPSASVPYAVRVEIPNLNIHKGPGTNYGITGKYTDAGVFTIVEEQSGSGSKAGWGKLKSGLGWISLDYCVKVWQSKTVKKTIGADKYLLRWFLGVRR